MQQPTGLTARLTPAASASACLQMRDPFCGYLALALSCGESILFPLSNDSIEVSKVAWVTSVLTRYADEATTVTLVLLVLHTTAKHAWGMQQAGAVSVL